MHSLYQSSKILEKNKARLIIGKQKGFLDDSLQPGSNYISSKIRKRKQNQESSGEMSQESEMWSELKGNLSMEYKLCRIQEESEFEISSSYQN